MVQLFLVLAILFFAASVLSVLMQLFSGGWSKIKWKTPGFFSFVYCRICAVSVSAKLT